MAKKKPVKKKVKNQDSLNPKQLRFCQEYVVDLNGTQAAIRSGYSKKTAEQQASRMLLIVKVQQKIKELQEKIEKELEISATWITQRFKEISDRCMTAEPVLKDGIPTGEYVFDSNGAIKATENLGKRTGYYEKHNNQKGLVIEVSRSKK
jgi:phage terminase small subunit